MNLTVGLTGLTRQKNVLLELAEKSGEIEKYRRSLEYADKAEKLVAYADKLEQEQSAALQNRRNEIKCLQELETAKTETDNAGKALESKADGDARLKELSAKTARLEAILVPAQALCNVSGELKKKQNELSGAQKAAADSETELKAMTEKLDGLRVKIKDNFDKYIGKLPELKSNKQTLDLQLQGFVNLHKQEAAATELETTLLKKRAEYKAVSFALKNEKAKFENMQSAFENDAAFRLAISLHEGKPCPVCGSLSHPVPAGAASDAPPKEEIEKQKALIAELEAKLAELVEEGGKQSGKFDAAQKRLCELQSECENYGCGENDVVEKQKTLAAALDEAEKIKLLQQSP